MTTPRPHRIGASVNRAPETVDLDVDLSGLEVIGLKELQHAVEGELAHIERSEAPGATGGQLAQHGAGAADPDRSRRLRNMLVSIDDHLSGRTDTSAQPTGE